MVNKAYFWLNYGNGLIILRVENTAYLVEYRAVWGLHRSFNDSPTTRQRSRGSLGMIRDVCRERVAVS